MNLRHKTIGLLYLLCCHHALVSAAAGLTSLLKSIDGDDEQIVYGDPNFPYDKFEGSVWESDSEVAARLSSSTLKSYDDLFSFDNDIVPGWRPDNLKMLFEPDVENTIIRQRINRQTEELIEELHGKVPPSLIEEVESSYASMTSQDSIAAFSSERASVGLAEEAGWGRLLAQIAVKAVITIGAIMVALLIDYLAGGTACTFTSGTCGNCRTATAAIYSTNPSFTQKGPFLLREWTRCDAGKICSGYSDFIESTGYGGGKGGNSPYSTFTGTSCWTRYRVMTTQGEFIRCHIDILMSNPFAGPNSNMISVGGTGCPPYLRVDKGFTANGGRSQQEFFIYFDSDFALWTEPSTWANKYDPNQVDPNVDPDNPVNPDCDPENPFACPPPSKALPNGLEDESSLIAPAPAPQSSPPSAAYSIMRSSVVMLPVVAAVTALFWHRLGRQ